MLTKRTQILFDEKMWKYLQTRSKHEKKSIGQIVRDSVNVLYESEDTLKKRQKAIQSILKNRPAPSKTPIDYKELIDYGRKY